MYDDEHIIVFRNGVNNWDYWIESWLISDSSFERVIADNTELFNSADSYRGMDVSSDGKYAALRNMVKTPIIDMETGKIVRWIGGVGGIRFSPDGKRLAVTFCSHYKGSNSFDQLWTIEMGTWKYTSFPVVEPANGWEQPPSFSSGGRYIVTQGGFVAEADAGNYGTASFWIFDTETGKVFPIKGIRSNLDTSMYAPTFFPFFSLDSTTIYTGEYSLFWAYDVSDITNGVNSVNDNSALQKNFSITPNPAQNQIVISFMIQNYQETVIDIVDTLGTVIVTILNERLQQGIHEIQYNLNNLVSGQYFVRLHSGNTLLSQPLTITR